MAWVARLAQLKFGAGKGKGTLARRHDHRFYLSKETGSQVLPQQGDWTTGSTPARRLDHRFYLSEETGSQDHRFYLSKETGPQVLP